MQTRLYSLVAWDQPTASAHSLGKILRHDPVCSLWGLELKLTIVGIGGLGILGCFLLCSLSRGLRVFLLLSICCGSSFVLLILSALCHFYERCLQVVALVNSPI